MAHIAIILSENNLSDIIIEEIVCRNTCVERHYLLFAQKIRTLKQSLKPLLMVAILGKLLTKNRQFQMLLLV
jgi:hypothetical protein